MHGEQALLSTSLGSETEPLESQLTIAFGQVSPIRRKSDTVSTGKASLHYVGVEWQGYYYLHTPS